MSDIFQVNTQIINNNALPAILFLLGAIIVLFLNRFRIIRSWLNFKTQYRLNHLGLEQITNITCPDGLGGEFNIDRLVLRPDGISLIAIKKYPGRIFCADHIDEWTQMLGQKSYSFKNPLFELDYQVKAISDCIPHVSVDGYLFFDHLAIFPRGHPQRVIHPDRIPESFYANAEHSVDSDVMEAWHQLKSIVSH